MNQSMSERSRRIRDIYYIVKPLLPRRLQIFLRRKLVLYKRESCKGIWPIDESASKPPEAWPGWPDHKQFALVLTHDVEKAKGLKKYLSLVMLEEKLGFRSSFYFVPERYYTPPKARHFLTCKGFEVGIHGLYHDGKLYKTREIFQQRAVRINYYLKEWNAVGFRSPYMHHNLEWLHALNIQYDASTFDTDPFEPQPDGVRTIFPFWAQSKASPHKYVELPYTLPQDFTLFILMREKNIDVWKKKLDWIIAHGGMALVNTHPDYMHFDGKKCGLEEYPAAYYMAFLEYIKENYEGKYWHALPRDVASFWALTFSPQAA
jgi:hypothetical protein